jgi:hypothetical protein
MSAFAARSNVIPSLTQLRPQPRRRPVWTAEKSIDDIPTLGTTEHKHHPRPAASGKPQHARHRNVAWAARAGEVSK